MTISLNVLIIQARILLTPVRRVQVWFAFPAYAAHPSELGVHALTGRFTGGMTMQIACGQCGEKLSSALG